MFKTDDAQVCPTRHIGNTFSEHMGNTFGHLRETRNALEGVAPAPFRRPSCWFRGCVPTGAAPSATTTNSGSSPA